MYFRHTFILGGARSGKSKLAENLVTLRPEPWNYIATAQAFDPEMAQRIAAHADRRGAGWVTVEAPLDVAAALDTMPQGAAVLFDCATLWLSNHLLAESDLEAEITALLTAMDRFQGYLVTVSNEVGHGIVPENALARRFRDAQGVLNQRLAAAADTAVLVAAGLPVVLKGALPEAMP